MSVCLYVFAVDSRIPSIPALQEASHRAGVSLTFNSEVNLREHEGFLPVRHGDRSTGFELYVGRTSEVLSEYPEDIYPEFHANVAARDAVVIFSWHSDAEEGIAANYAAAILAQLTDGVLFDPEAGEIIPTDAALEHARTFAGEMSGSR